MPMGRSRYQAIDTHPHFITCTVVNWLTLFSQPEITAVVLLPGLAGRISSPNDLTGRSVESEVGLHSQ